MHFFNRHIVAVSIDTGIFSIIHFRMADSKRRRLAYTRKWKSVHRNLKKVSSINRPIYSDSDDSTDDTEQNDLFNMMQRLITAENAEEVIPEQWTTQEELEERCERITSDQTYRKSLVIIWIETCQVAL